jgi:hypothetical protein
MEKRNAKRIKRVEDIDIDFKIAKAMTEQEEIRKLELLNLIVEIIVEATLRDLYGDRNCPNDVVVIRKLN